MASRRMFSSSITGSARFLRMGQSARLLYYDLGMAADDEGVAEAFTVMRTTGASEDDLRVLAAKGFIIILNEDLVSFISDWNENNYIRPERRKKSVYSDLLVRVLNGEEMPFLPAVGQMSDNCTTNDSQMSAECQNRLGKVSIGEDRIVESRIEDGDNAAKTKSKKPARHKYGEYNNVLLSDEDFEKLKAEFPNDYQKRIDRLSEYMQSTGKAYKDHLATIRSWARKEQAGQKQATDYYNPDVLGAFDL